jgi:selenide,water dikinase
VLRLLPVSTNPDVIVGTETSDDAGVFRLRPDLAIVNTVDFFTPIVDDPYVFGQIAAANALSDVYAMGGDPTTALNIVAFPKSRLDMSVLAEILKGGAERAEAAGAVVIGGHTIIDQELKYGMAVTGVVHPDRVIRNVGVRPGDALVLTKALGTGIIATALKRRAASNASTDAAISSMVMLNRVASELMRQFTVHACSDVTGFGLLGHAYEMASGSNVTLSLDAVALPLLDGALELATQGHLTGGCGRNREYLLNKVLVGTDVAPSLVEIAYDPQTSGGLMIAVPDEEADRLVVELRRAGVPAAARIGHALRGQDAFVLLT